MRDEAKGKGAIPFEVFASFERIEQGNPILALRPPLWAAATHAIVVEQTVHYFWCKRERDVRWLLMHATAPVDDLTAITQDARNPILVPSEQGFDDAAVEYPFPFLNPADGRFYMYYRGKGKVTPEQTGLLVSDGDMGRWTRVRRTPVIPAEHAYEADGSTHPSVAVDGDTIHIVYTGKATKSYHDGLTMCHATAPASDPAAVTKNPANPVFTGSGQAWDSRAVRETELFKGPWYFHVLYGGYDGEVWRIGHIWCARVTQLRCALRRERQTSAAAVSFCDGRTGVPFHSGMSSPTFAPGMPSSWTTAQCAWLSSWSVKHACSAL